MSHSAVSLLPLSRSRLLFRLVKNLEREEMVVKSKLK